jgi:hypothetical protein
MPSRREKLALHGFCGAKGCLRDYRRVESNHLPPDYEPGELPLLYGGTSILPTQRGESRAARTAALSNRVENIRRTIQERSRAGSSMAETNRPVPSGTGRRVPVPATPRRGIVPAGFRPGVPLVPPDEPQCRSPVINRFIATPTRFTVAGAGLEPASSRFAPNAPGRASCPCLPVSPSRQENHSSGGGRVKGGRTGRHDSGIDSILSVNTIDDLVFMVRISVS